MPRIISLNPLRDEFFYHFCFDEAQSVQKSLAEDYADFRSRSGSQGYPTPKAVLFMAMLYCLPLNIKGTKKELGEALDTRRHGLCLGPVGPSDWCSP